MEACSLLVNLRKGMQSSSEQPLVGEEHCVTTLITAAKETSKILTIEPMSPTGPGLPRKPWTPCNKTKIKGEERCGSKR